MGEQVTEFVRRTSKKHGRTIVGGGSLGLSAVAVIWMFHTFVTVHQYEKDLADQKATNKALWSAIQEKGNK